MRYIFIDRVLRLEHNQQLLAIKNVSLSEDVFSEHFVGCPIMPGALQIEALAQAGTILLEVSADFRKKALLVIVQQAKFRSLVRPGDQLSIEMKMVSFSETSAQLEGTIYIDKQLVMTAVLIFALKAVDEYYPPTAKSLIEMQYDIWLRDAQLIGFNKK